MGYRTFPVSIKSGGAEGLAEAKEGAAEEVQRPATVLVLLAAVRAEEARVKPPPHDVSTEGPVRLMVENVMAGIQAVHSGEAESYLIEGPEGFAPMSLTADNIGRTFYQLRDLVGHEFPDILHPAVELHYEEEIPINAGVRPEL